jgi:uncharacterized protein DUF3455
MIIQVILLISFLAIIPTAVDAAPTNIGVLATTLALYSSQYDLSGITVRSCPLDNVSPPLNDTSPQLDGPSPGLSLKYVALGRGTQNYTCLGNDSNAAPTAIGAVATLFDSSCLAVFLLNIFNDIPPALVQMPHDAAVAAAIVIDQLSTANDGSVVFGQHYFVNSVTPTGYV